MLVKINFFYDTNLFVINHKLVLSAGNPIYFIKYQDLLYKMNPRDYTL